MERTDPDGAYGGPMPASSFGDVTLEVGDDHVGIVEVHRPPNNYFDVELIRSIADAYAAADADAACRAIVLCSEGRHFCAGADFTGSSRSTPLASSGADGARELYAQAVRLFEAETPVVAAVQGAAIGGGLGLACSADFRIGSDASRFAANFARLGFHHGFGLTVTLPPLVGQQRSLELLYTGGRVGGVEAAQIGLLDLLVEPDVLHAEARAFAADIAISAPLAVRSIRQTMRGDLAERVRDATAREDAEQARLRKTSDWAEGVRASAERREPRFEGR